MLFLIPIPETVKPLYQRFVVEKDNFLTFEVKFHSEK